MRISESNRDITNYFFYKPYDEYTSIEAHFTDNTFYDNERLQPVEPPVTHKPFNQVSNNELILGVPYTCISRGDEELHIQVFVTFRHPDFQIFEGDDDSFTLRYEITDWEPEDRPFMDDKTVDAPVVKCVDPEEDETSEPISDRDASIKNFEVQRTENPGEVEATGTIEFRLPDGEQPEIYIDWNDLTIKQIDSTVTDSDKSEEVDVREVNFSTTHQYNSPNLFTPKLTAFWRPEASMWLPNPSSSTDWPLNLNLLNDIIDDGDYFFWPTFNPELNVNIRRNLENALAPPSIEDLGLDGGTVLSSDNKLQIDIPSNMFDVAQPVAIQKMDLSQPFGYDEKDKVVIYDINIPNSDFMDDDWQLRANYNEFLFSGESESEIEFSDNSYQMNFNLFETGFDQPRILFYDDFEESEPLQDLDTLEELDNINFDMNQPGLRTRIFNFSSNYSLYDTEETTVTIPGHKLTVVKDGNGSGTVFGNDKPTRIRLRGEPAPMPPITCGGNCSSSFIEGTTVTNTPVPDPDSYFAGFSDNCQQSSGFPCTIEMNRSETVTATFMKRDEENHTNIDQPPGVITGRVGLDGQPLAGAVVEVIVPGKPNHITLTDADGIYTFEDIQAEKEVTVTFNPDADYYCPGGRQRTVTVISSESRYVNFECFTRKEKNEEVTQESMREVIDGFTEGKWSLGGGLGITTTRAFNERIGDQPQIAGYETDNSSIQFTAFGERSFNQMPFNLDLPGRVSVGADISYRDVNFEQMWIPGNGLPNRTIGQVNIITIGAYALLSDVVTIELWEMGFRPFLILGSGIIWNNGNFTLNFRNQNDESFSRNHQTAYPRIAIGFDVSLNEWFELRTSLNAIQGVGADSFLGGNISLIYNLFRNAGIEH